jgi:hypothetical protein
MPKHPPIVWPPLGSHRAGGLGCNALLSASGCAKLPETPQFFADFENFLTDGVGMYAPTDRSMIGIRQGTN